ncbi:MAG: autotransporter outer membrane beta-barrel domain-containing protein [Parvibaculum sp.]|uniref:autotransporter domain-containing protein n=1 Tax=Parvibaculum sp. TaxID=2024848 RepID=UPI003C70E102
MNARLTFRSLLTTTSVAALLVASHGVQAAPPPSYYNPEYTTVDQIFVNSAVPYVTNGGTITNATGKHGIHVSGALVNGSVDNEGGISVSGGNALRGMFIDNASDIRGDFENDGSIAVTAQGEGPEQSARYAAGMEAVGGSGLRGHIRNDGLIDVEASVANVDHSSGEGSTSLAAQVDAYGIRLDNSGDADGAGRIENSGSIDVSAQATVDQSASEYSYGNASADGIGDARAYAAGIDGQNHGAVGGDHRGPRIAAEIDLWDDYYASGIDVSAVAQSFTGVEAAVVCEETGEDYCESGYARTDIFDTAIAQAYGATFSGNAAVIDGDVYSGAPIEVSALAETVSLSDASSAWGGVRSYAGYHEYDDEEYFYYDTSLADAWATGLNLDVLQINGDIEIYNEIDVLATALGTSTATGEAAGHIESAATNAAVASARGIAVNTLLAGGEFFNEAGVAARAVAGSENSATATSADESDSGAYSEARANAAGIEFLADALGGAFVNDVYDEEYFELNAVSGSALAEARSTASSVGGDDSEAWAWGEAIASGIGIKADIGSIAGHFINESEVVGDARALGEQIASATGGYDVSAGAGSDWIEASASGIELETRKLAGSFFNDGDVRATALASGSSNAAATGEDEASAGAWNSISANASGIVVDAREVQDSIRNHGDIHASANAVSVQTVSAETTGDGDGNSDASASAGGFMDDGIVHARAVATGLDITSHDVGGNVVNTGDILSEATAWVSSVVNATSDADGDAMAWAAAGVQAEGYGIRARLGDVGYGYLTGYDEDFGKGNFVNDDDIDVRVEAGIEQSSIAQSEDGNAIAVAVMQGSAAFVCFDDCGGDNAVAYGIAVESDEGTAYLNGSFVNLDDINVTALAEAEMSTRAIVDDGDDTLALAVAGGALSSCAVGISLYEVGADGGFYNDDDISVQAAANVRASAIAESDDGPAYARLGSDLTYSYMPEVLAPNAAMASATGVRVGYSEFDDGLMNASTISALALASAEASAEAYGDEIGSAHVWNAAAAEATGMDLDASWFGDDVINRGRIAAIALAEMETEAFAHGDEADAYIGSRIDYGFLGDGGDDAQSHASAVGLASGNYDGITLLNLADEDGEEAGEIIALAGTYGDNYAEADGLHNASAEVVNAQSADAIGYAGETYGGDYGDRIVNDGLIVAGAMASGKQEARARATSRTSEAGAIATDASYASAKGIETAAWEVTNRGQVFAGALALSEAVASAEGAEAQAEATASAEAGAVGIAMAGMGDYSSFYNSGEVAAYAVARAHAEASVSYRGDDEGFWRYVSAYAQADAIGVDLVEDGYVSDFHNDEDGVIAAIADAEATIGAAEFGYSHARAMGVHVAHAQVDAIRNDGTISAQATAGDHAFAIGVHVDGGQPTDGGSLVNTGTIVAEATGGSAFATGILVSNSGWLDTIDNSGSIVARIEDTSEFELFEVMGSSAAAIDIQEAGRSITIGQLDGSILGDILMSNENGDTINWSGGTITGDIYGNSGTGGDALNVFAGLGDAFAYSGTIDGLANLAINGGEYRQKVGLYLTNTVRNTDNLYVGENATLRIGKAASVSVDALNLDRAAVLAFDLAHDSVSGVINTTSADLNGATVKAVFVDPWEPSSQVYRVINWDGSDTRFGSVVSSSLLERVVAQYGDDGVDLLVSRLGFTEITGLRPDANSLANALDRIFQGVDPDSELGRAIFDLIHLTSEEYEAALNDIAGEQTGDVQSLTFGQAGSLIHVIQTQLSEIRGGQMASSGLNSLGIRVASNQVMASMSDAPQQGFGNATSLGGEWSAWARVFGDWADLKRSSVAEGFKSTSGGVVAGADYRFSTGFVAGLAAGYQNADLDFRSRGKGDISSWSVTAYGDYRIGAAYIDALVGYSKQSYDLDRYMNVLGVGYTANADYDGSSIIGSIETGYELALDRSTKLTPFAGVNFTNTKADAVTETGAGIWNLAYEDRSANAIDSVLGARLSRTFVTEGGTRFTPTIELGWKHGFGDTSPTANAALAGTPGSNFQIFGSTVSRDTAIAGAALAVQMTDAVDAYVQYNGQFSSNYSDNTASLRLRLKF